MVAMMTAVMTAVTMEMATPITLPTKRKRSRRGHNEGSIRQRADGRWEAVVSLGNGKRKWSYAPTRAEAQRKLQALLRDVERGLAPVDERQTVGTFLHDWLATLPATNLKASTIERHRCSVEQHLVPHLGRVRLAKLTPVQVQRAYAESRAAGLGPTSVHHLHETLHKALGYAVRVDMLPRNVCDLVDVPRTQVKEMQVFSRDEVRTFLTSVHATASTDEALFAVALSSGMRLSELLALRWRDVDTAHDAQGAVRVQATLARPRTSRGAWRLEEPKTKRSRRQIPLPTSVMTLLDAHKTAQDEARKRMSAVWQAHDFVFCDASGAPLTKEYTYRKFLRICREADLPRLRFHDLRHTCATLLLTAGVNPKVVSERLGHASVSITLDIYSHVLPGMQQTATDALELAMSPRGREIVKQITETSLQSQATMLS